MSIKLSAQELRTTDKQDILNAVAKSITKAGYTITEENREKPWGASFMLAEDGIEDFAKTFFLPVQNIVKEQQQAGLTLTPKILVVAPEQRLSWQYHHRRKELWRVVNGPVGVVTNDTDQLPDNIEPYNEPDIVTMAKGQRHRLVGLKNWGVIAEIWIHTDPKNPSNEEDIVRVEDDYNR